MFEADLVWGYKLPASGTLLEVDFLFPVVRSDTSRKHNDGGVDNLVRNGIVGIDDGEGEIVSEGIVRDVGRGPVRGVREFGVCKEGVGIFDFLKKTFFAPRGVIDHIVSVEGFHRVSTAWDVTVNDFVPNCWFGRRDVIVTGR